MKKIYSADNLIMAGHVKGLLESNSIECIIKNQNLAGAIGELPPVECWPEVWVINDEDNDRALKIVTSVITDDQTSKTAWTCDCGETIEGQFSACWQCGKDRLD
ncbi:MAG: DUF2007 domain-containing protein [Calditrichia bacterium]